MKSKFIPLFLLSIFALGCKVTFVPNYDAAIEQEIVSAAKANDKLYLNILAADPDKRAYSNYVQAYADVESEINSIQLNEKARKKNTDMVAIVALIQKHFTEYQNEHKNAKKVLNDAEIKAYEDDMKALWEPLLLAERGLPHTVPAN